MRTRYAPPPIDQSWLLAHLVDTFDAGENDTARSLLRELVHGYLIWWMLMVTFPSRRIVGTAPLWEVRRIHASDLERFFADCFDYLGRIPRKKDLWGGAMDFRGTHDTARSLNELFDHADLVWQPILRTAEQQRSNTIIRLH